jgi:VanZ family protein
MTDPQEEPSQLGSTIRMQKLFRTAAWLLILAIVILSLAPAAVRPTTIAGSGAEHFFIFLATGLAFGFGYPRKPWFIASVLLIFAAFIEITQNWVPGRHARMSDFVIDSVATSLGIGLSSLSRSFSHRLFGRKRDNV